MNIRLRNRKSADLQSFLAHIIIPPGLADCCATGTSTPGTCSGVLTLDAKHLYVSARFASAPPPPPPPPSRRGPAAIGERCAGRSAHSEHVLAAVASEHIRGPCSKKESDWLTRVAGLDEYEAEGIAKALS